MNDFDGIRALGTYDHFTVFESFSKSRKFPVIVKKCEYSRIEEAEFLIRSALMKTKDGVYSQPLLSIEADIDLETAKTWIIFVWKKGAVLDSEIEQDRESLFPPGNSGYENFRAITKNSNTGGSIKKALCPTLRKEITIKKYKSANLRNMNLVLKEALAQATCSHPNICEFFDFRFFAAKSGKHCAYIVMERLEQDLASEIKTRKELSQRYEEAELIGILQDVTAALLHTKSHGLAHRDIKPANILRGPQGLKLADFGSAWLPGLFSETASVQGSIPYMSPEAVETMDNLELLQKPFESDVFSLGMTMLHLAAMDLPPRTAGMSELEAVLQQSVHTLTYSDEFKGLLIAMLRPAAEERPTLETVREVSTRIQQLVPLSLPAPRVAVDKEAAKSAFGSPEMTSLSQKTIKQYADNLFMQARAYCENGDYRKAVEMYAAADSIYSRLFPNDIYTAHNLANWGFALSNMGSDLQVRGNLTAARSVYSEAVRKCAAADSIYSRLFPDDINAAHNLLEWGVALKNMENPKEAVKKHAAADSIYSRLPNDIDTAKNLSNWGLAFSHMIKHSKAEEKYAAADSIYSRVFPNNKDTATNLNNWGRTLNMMYRYREAVEKYAAAHSIYSRLFPNDINTAYNLSDWGSALRNMGNRTEAMEKFAAADSIYSRLPEDIATADNLCTWGLNLENIKNYSEAVGKYETARALHVLYESEFQARTFDDLIAKLT